MKTSLSKCSYQRFKKKKKTLLESEKVVDRIYHQTFNYRRLCLNEEEKPSISLSEISAVCLYVLDFLLCALITSTLNKHLSLHTAGAIVKNMLYGALMM